MNIKHLFCFALVLSTTARADIVTPSTIFPLALQKGSVSLPAVLMNTKYSSLVQHLKQSTKDDGEIVIQAKRLYWFKQQNHCGRIRFDLAQPTSSKEWPEYGGELNICVDGTPPLRLCKENPNTLVPFNKLCANGTVPVDTQEVSAAIHEANTRGQLTLEQAIAKSSAKTMQKEVK